MEMEFSRRITKGNLPLNAKEYETRVLREQREMTQNLLKTNLQGVFSPSLLRKVDSRGDFLDYYGDTVVMKFPNKSRELLKEVSQMLHQEVSHALSNEIDPENYHITLRSISSHTQQERMQSKWGENITSVAEIFKTIKGHLQEHPEERSVFLKPTMLYNSVDISLAVGFVPANDKDFRILMKLCNFFETMERQGDFQRFHATMAYFKPVSFTTGDVANIHRVLSGINQKYFNGSNTAIEFPVSEIMYQRFFHMNHYQDVFAVEDELNSLEFRSK